MELKKNKMEHQILKPFGPSIIKIKIPQDTIDQINLFVDEIVNNKDKLEKFNEGSKLAGNVYQEFLMDTDFMKKIKWGEFLGQASNHWILEEKKSQLKSFQIIKSWIVRQFKNEYNPIHFHDGQISGVGYLKIPKGMNKNKLVKNKKIETNGTIDFINGQKNFLSKCIYNLNPKVNDLLIFPNYLMHTAYPFNEDGERRSFSFNAKINFKK